VPIHPFAGKPASPDRLVDVDRLRREFYDRAPDIGDRSERVAFG
jgi:phosphoglucomutase